MKHWIVSVRRLQSSLSKRMKRVPQDLIGLVSAGTNIEKSALRVNLNLPHKIVSSCHFFDDFDQETSAMEIMCAHSGSGATLLLASFLLSAQLRHLAMPRDAPAGSSYVLLSPAWIRLSLHLFNISFFGNSKQLGIS